jgi:predicted lysophospholipase L1 biosynthesis ABC-type transport system permease subunit|tara:strand:- start:169 stop:531 length:363 start_codon:yes stop_codon:yes gene_type:complete
MLFIVALYMLTGMSDPEELGAFIFNMAYLSLPYVLPLVASVRYLRGGIKQASWPMAGVIAGFLACVFYSGALIYDAPEDVLDLILTVMPAYHLVMLAMTGGVASYIINKSHLNEYPVEDE